MSSSLIDLIRLAASVYSMIIIARVVLSWVKPSAENPLVALVYRVTEPVLGPVRSILPSFGGFDFSPILVLVAIQVVVDLVISALAGA